MSHLVLEYLICVAVSAKVFPCCCVNPNAALKWQILLTSRKLANREMTIQDKGILRIHAIRFRLGALSEFLSPTPQEELINDLT